MPRTKALIFSKFARDEDAYQALRVRARGCPQKTAPREELVAAIRTTAAGGSYLPPSAPSGWPIASPGPPSAPGCWRFTASSAGAGATKELGAAPFIAEGILKRHVSNLFQKLRADDWA